MKKMGRTRGAAYLLFEKTAGFILFCMKDFSRNPRKSARKIVCLRENPTGFDGEFSGLLLTTKALCATINNIIWDGGNPGFAA